MTTRKINPEIHLFIVWNNSCQFFEYILNDLEESFEVIDIYRIRWTPELFQQNLSRFYGGYSSLDSVRYRGIGEFYVIIFRDNNPVYDSRKPSSGGIKLVNTNVFDKKSGYRSFIRSQGKVPAIHATDDPSESERNLWMLLGRETADFLLSNGIKCNGGIHIKSMSCDLLGSQGWESLELVFKTLNKFSKYIVLRTFEDLPCNYSFDGKHDIDILIDDIQWSVYLLNGSRIKQQSYREQYYVKVCGHLVNFDFRCPGDDYYCLNFSNRLLENRVYNESGYYEPSILDYFYSLLYNGLVHKKALPEKYSRKLISLSSQIHTSFDGTHESGINLLKKFLVSNHYNIPKSLDKRAYFNVEVALSLQSDDSNRSSNLSDDGLLHEYLELDSIMELDHESIMSSVTKYGCQQASNISIALQNHKLGNLDLAQSMYIDFLNKNRQHAQVLHQLGLLMYQRHEPDVSENLILLSLRIDPSLSVGYHNLGVACQALEKYDAAINSYKKVLTLVPHHRVFKTYNNLSQIFLKFGQYDAARHIAYQSIKANPEFAPAYLSLSRVLIQKNKIKQAVLALHKSLALRPRYHVAIETLKMISARFTQSN